MLRNIRSDSSRNGDVVRAEEGSALKAGEIRQVTFTETLNSSHEDMNTYHAEVVMAGDENTSDNATEEFKIRLRRMDFPGVRDLKAVREESGNVTLRWTEPEQMPEDDEAYTEGFESAETDVVFPDRIRRMVLPRPRRRLYRRNPGHGTSGNTDRLAAEFLGARHRTSGNKGF